MKILVWSALLLASAMTVSEAKCKVKVKKEVCIKTASDLNCTSHPVQNPDGCYVCPQEHGEKCSCDLACANNLRCHYGICTEKVAVNCSVAAMDAVRCPYVAVRDSDGCYVCAQGVGEKCDCDHPCAGHHQCTDGVCEYKPCEGHTLEGCQTPIQYYFDETKQYCAACPKARVNETCRSTVNCAPGQICYPKDETVESQDFEYICKCKHTEENCNNKDRWYNGVEWKVYNTKKPWAGVWGYNADGCPICNLINGRRCSIKSALWTSENWLMARCQSDEGFYCLGEGGGPLDDEGKGWCRKIWQEDHGEKCGCDLPCANDLRCHYGVCTEKSAVNCSVAAMDAVSCPYVAVRDSDGCYVCAQGLGEKCDCDHPCAGHHQCTDGVCERKPSRYEPCEGHTLEGCKTPIQYRLDGNQSCAVCPKARVNETCESADFCAPGQKCAPKDESVESQNFEYICQCDVTEENCNNKERWYNGEEWVVFDFQKTWAGLWGYNADGCPICNLINGRRCSIKSDRSLSENWPMSRCQSDEGFYCLGEGGGPLDDEGKGWCRKIWH